MLQPKRFVRKPLYINAVQVTHENMNEVAQWSGGEVRTARNPKTLLHDPFVHIAVVGAKHQRQTMAFQGDWVLHFRDHFKIYTKKAFPESFDAAPEEPYLELLRERLAAPPPTEYEKIFMAGVHNMAELKAQGYVN